MLPVKFNDIVVGEYDDDDKIFYPNENWKVEGMNQKHIVVSARIVDGCFYLYNSVSKHANERTVLYTIHN